MLTVANTPVYTPTDTLTLFPTDIPVNKSTKTPANTLVYTTFNTLVTLGSPTNTIFVSETKTSAPAPAVIANHTSTTSPDFIVIAPAEVGASEAHGVVENDGSSRGQSIIDSLIAAALWGSGGLLLLKILLPILVRRFPRVQQLVDRWYKLTSLKPESKVEINIYQEIKASEYHPPPKQNKSMQVTSHLIVLIFDEVFRRFTNWLVRVLRGPFGKL
jgi:hypothetical protein